MLYRNDEYVPHESSSSVFRPRRSKMLVGIALVGVLMLLVNMGSAPEVVEIAAPLSLSAETAKQKEAEHQPPSDVESKHPLYKITGDLKDAYRFFHISDTHVDPFFNPTMSMIKGVCHSCQFSDQVYGFDSSYCPTEIPITLDGEETLISDDYAFGRYGCNPPYRLFKSLLNHMKSQDPNPDFIVFTGDTAPHGFPGDKFKPTPETKIEDLCETKFLVHRQQVRDMVRHFPNTKWAYTMGNNDYFPKNTYWQPYITKLGNMFLEEGYFTQEQHSQFVKYGSNYIDHDGIRFLSIGLTLFAKGGETSFVDPKTYQDLGPADKNALQYPVRHRTIQWVEQTLKDAEEKGMSVYLIGHQPLNTNKGKDELDVEGLHFGRMKNLLAEYGHIIKVGFFGHRNLAGLAEILSPLGTPLIPSITGPGVSPRGRNQPSFNVIYTDRKEKHVLEFEQWIFNLMDENNNIKSENTTYAGEWKQHENDVYSWRALSGEKEFTTASLARTLRTIPKDSRRFFAIQVWKRGGYIGDETPESYTCKAQYDTADGMMSCLFRNQDPKCWQTAWLN